MFFRKLVLASFLALSLVACGDDDPPANNSDNDMSESDTDTPNNVNNKDDMGDDADMGDDMTDPDMGEERRETCDTAPPAEPSGLACATTAGSNGSTLIHAGTVLTPNVIYDNGYVLYDDAGQITCVGCGCAQEAAAADATVVACTQGVVSPSLINGHEHMRFSLSQPQSSGDERYEHRHDWRAGLRGHSRLSRSPGSDSSREAYLFIELRNLFGATTSIVGSASGSGVAGLLRNLDANSQSEGLSGIDVKYETFPLGDATPSYRTGDCNYRELGNDYNPSGIYFPHIAEGIDKEARNEYLCLSDASYGVDIVQQNTTIVHAIGMTANDIADFAGSGSRLVWSPRTNISLYGMTARIPVFKNFGIPIALGTDWSPSGSANILRELKCADYLNDNHYNGLLTDRELWLMATLNGAIAFGADNQIGSLQVGRVADIAIFDGSFRQDYRAIIDSGPADVLLVTRGGTPLIGDANVIEALVPAADIDACETIEVCNRPRRLCVERDTGLTFAAIKAAVDPNSYGPLFCDTPPDEPSCIPFRMNEYDGTVDAGDSDGDGIPNAEDLCSDLFSPLRSIEDGAQTDVDGDMIGDECDMCPLTVGDTCEVFDPDDRDSDTIKNVDDNCPNTANTDQADQDNDGIGDVCDVCPDFDNTNASYCPATVYQLRDGTFALGSEVQVAGGIVTAVSADLFFMQVDAGDPAFAGINNSGIQVYMANGAVTERPTIGDIVTVVGTVDSFGDQLQISTVSAMTIDSSGNTVPAPQDVATSDITTGGPQADNLQGILVRVIDVVVTDPNPDAPNDYGEFAVTDGLRVDDLLFAITPRPALNDPFAAIIGILGYGFGNAKIYPRSETDVSLGPPVLIGLEPMEAYITANATNQDTTPPLEVVLSNAPTADTTVTLTYSGSITGPATIDVASGQTRVSIPLTSTSVGAASVTATMDTETFTSNITVFDDTTARSVASLSPDMQDLTINQALTLTVTLNVPAPAAGQMVMLTYAPGVQVSGPASVLVAPGALSANFDVQAGGVAGNEMVTASVAGSNAAVTINVIEPPANCLIISEYIEGSGADNKAIELYNCSGVSLELSDYGVCLISNAGTTCNNQTMMGAKMLPANAVHTLCRTTGGQAAADIKANCNEATGVMNFNGDDRLIIFKDEDASGGFNTGDIIVDAFGETTVRPASPPWANQTLRRCDFTPYDGMSPFTASTYYKAFAQDDASDYGTAPVEGCN